MITGKRFVYPTLIASVLTTAVFICTFSVESFTNSGGGLREKKGASWHLQRTIINVKTIVTHSSTINTTVSTDCVQLSDQTNGFRPLPLSVSNGVKTFVFFIGIGRSGHSIVASILDSHPHMVVSNELNLFKMLNTSWCATADKSFLFNQIWNRSYIQATTSLKDPSKGYTLAIDGLYQGSYVSRIDVIGDKMGGSTAALFLSDPARFERHLTKLRSLLNIPIKVFHVIRNPYDNIATKSLHMAFKLQYSKFAAVKRDNISVTINDKLIDQQIAQYFQFYNASEALRRTYKMDMMELHNMDLITNPKAVIREMCHFLSVHCSNEYLNAASNKVFNDQSKTRYNVKWKNKQILLVKQNIQKFETLHRYLDFNH